MYKNRIELYERLEDKLNSKLLVYITGDRQGFEAQIGGDVVDYFIEQLDKIGVVKKLTLYLYTRGGSVSVAWNIVNLLRLFCDELQVVIPHKARSAGTLISIGANSIVMTKQATLGPIDPSLNGPLNPVIPFSHQTYPVSVEAVKGYIAFAKKELAITDNIALSNLMIKLSETVHPLVLGQVYRTQAQIKMLAKKLLNNQLTDKHKIQRITSFLCSDSGSHDYTINRREASNLGLNIVKPNKDEYLMIKAIYDDIADELGLGQPEKPKDDYDVTRSLLESIAGGCHYYKTCGKRSVIPIGPTNPEEVIKDERTFDGWKYEPATAANTR